MAQKVEKFKRKTHIERTGPARRSKSISSEEDSLSPLGKKIKSTDHMELESGSETDDVIAALEVVKKVMPKIELVLETLDKMEKKLADTIEFQRIHRIGGLNPSQDKPRPIIAQFLRYSDRELVMSRAEKLKGKGFGISADLPKDIVKRRKELMPKFKKAKEDGQSAFFKRSEPDKLYVEGIRVY